MFTNRMKPSNVKEQIRILVIQQNVWSPDELVRNTHDSDSGVFLWIPAQLEI